MFLRSFVKNDLLFRSMDPLKRKSPSRTQRSASNDARTKDLSILNHALYRGSTRDFP